MTTVSHGDNRDFFWVIFANAEKDRRLLTRGSALIIQPMLLKSEAQSLDTRVFVCGPGYASGSIILRDLARDTLKQVPSVEAIYGEDIEKQARYKRLGTDLQTLEAGFAHDVDFTLLILESPGSIAELGTFTQLPALRGRLFVLLSKRYFRAESYIARGPLSLLSKDNPNSVIYFDELNMEDMLARVRYPVTFFKYAQYLRRFEYLRNTRLQFQRNVRDYAGYIKPLRAQYNTAVTLISVLVGDRASYAELLLLSGLAPKQLNAALHSLYEDGKVEKVGSGKYRGIASYQDSLLEPFSSTAISKCRARALATS